MTGESPNTLPYEPLPLEHPAGDHARHIPLLARALLMLLVLYVPHAWLFLFDGLWDTGRGRALGRFSWYLPGFVLYLFSPRAQRPQVGMPMFMLTGMFYFLMLIPRRPLAVIGMTAFGGAVALLNSWAVYLYLTRRL